MHTIYGLDDDIIVGAMNCIGLKDGMVPAQSMYHDKLQVLILDRTLERMDEGRVLDRQFERRNAK